MLNSKTNKNVENLPNRMAQEGLTELLRIVFSNMEAIVFYTERNLNCYCSYNQGSNEKVHSITFPCCKHCITSCCNGVFY